MRIEYLRNRIKEIEHQIVQSYKQLDCEIAQSLKDKIQERIYELRMELKNCKNELKYLCIKDELQQLNTLRKGLIHSEMENKESHEKANKLIKTYDETIESLNEELNG